MATDVASVSVVGDDGLEASRGLTMLLAHAATVLRSVRSDSAPELTLMGLALFDWR